MREKLQLKPNSPLSNGNQIEVSKRKHIRRSTKTTNLNGKTGKEKVDGEENQAHWKVEMVKDPTSKSESWRWKISS
ncbi:hypothetical protein V6N13_110169 [Hibiscus sabdariffa]